MTHMIRVAVLSTIVTRACSDFLAKSGSFMRMAQLLPLGKPNKSWVVPWEG
jgi:hypothetical protein